MRLASLPERLLFHCCPAMILTATMSSSATNRRRLRTLQRFLSPHWIRRLRGASCGHAESGTAHPALSVAEIWILIAAIGAFVAPLRAEPNGVIFEENVQPILAKHCFKCHSHSADRIKGGLVLDSRAGLLTGGDSGPAIVPGDPQKSLLIKAIGYGDEDLQMPPPKEGSRRLSDREIAAIAEWVALGAPWPGQSGQPTPQRGAITDQDRAWWAFQPLKAPQVPAVDDGGWCRNEIDRFVFARLQAEGLTPSTKASRQTLIRRVYFDLWGLPPSPQEVAQFTSDRSPNAYERLIDRLLSSPRYGERWARHWLDLVRYAESDGHR
jgi:hypothetical protein